MSIEEAIEILTSKGITVTKPFAGVWFCNTEQVRESEMIRWAIILDNAS